MSLLVTIGFGKNQLVKGTHRDEKLTINFAGLTLDLQDLSA